MKIEVSDGEIVDKLTILIIKDDHNTDPEKAINIKNELEYLRPLVDEIDPPVQLFDALYKVNLELWDVEDRLRIDEKHNNFSYPFIERARSVYKLNDRRAKIKREINSFTGSKFVEEKILPEYGEGI